MKAEPTTIFGRNLMALRKKKGLTRRELAKVLGINEVTLKSYEVLEREPRFELLIRFADFFGVTVDDLVRDKCFIKAPYCLVCDNKVLISEVEKFLYVEPCNKSDVAYLTGCLARELNSVIKLNDVTIDKEKIFNPEKVTDIALRCTTDDSKFFIYLNAKIERNLNPVQSVIQSFQDFQNTQR